VRAKNNHQQANRTGNRNRADTENHEDNQDNCTFDSKPVGRGIHGDYSILVALNFYSLIWNTNLGLYSDYYLFLTRREVFNDGLPL
jgi:hypothetical protein